jgi:bifunctional DNA-binding transcriptional regulator/antitoxin component of YhaV-PrlF toxin-antitoxin module
VAKVTSKLQVTVPRAIADRYGIEPGAEIEWVEAGDMIRVVPPRAQLRALDRKALLKLFDQATLRQRKRERMRKRAAKEPRHRGWRREDLYERGRTG